MSVFKKILLLLAIIGGINWGIYGIWGFNAVAQRSAVRKIAKAAIRMNTQRFIVLSIFMVCD